MSEASLHRDLEILQNHRIYFGHQSVGFNIMQGFRDILKDNPDLSINFITLEKPVKLPRSYFLDSRIGENQKPLTKCDAFLKSLDTRIVSNLEVALMKFCYVDITEQTDVESLFRAYSQTIDSLRTAYPQIRFVHVTTPLTAREGGIKGFIKRLLGRPDDTIGDNIKRNQFNDLLRKHYEGQPIFDLAGVESTYPDGARESFIQGGKTYYALVPGYASDGAHLNELGSRRAAAVLASTLAGILR